MTDDALALIGQRHALVRTLQQGEPQLPLQFLDRAAQGRLRDVQDFGGLENASPLVNGNERLELMKFQA
ncbi:hypothetical protein D3C75_1158810 [compost metagenome]